MADSPNGYFLQSSVGIIFSESKLFYDWKQKKYLNVNPDIDLMPVVKHFNLRYFRSLEKDFTKWPKQWQPILAKATIVPESNGQVLFLRNNR